MGIHTDSRFFGTVYFKWKVTNLRKTSRHWLVHSRATGKDSMDEQQAQYSNRRSHIGLMSNTQT